MKQVIMGLVLCLLLAGCSGTNNIVPEPSPGASPAVATPNASPPPTQTPPPSSVLEPGTLQSTLGFGDTTGKRILITDGAGKEQQMSKLTLAVGHNGQTLKVKYLNWQPASEDNTARETAVNIPNLSGYLYAVEEGAAAPNETYYMADDSVFDVEALVSVTPAAKDTEAPAVDEAIGSTIATAKGREILRIWKLADLGTEGEVYVTQFVRDGNDMLFSIVLKSGEDYTYMDYPAVIQGDEYSVWRVDDGGEITPEMFSVLLAARTEQGILLGLNWWGAEGVSTFFLNQDGEQFKELDIQYGRYISP
ncbi:hypothetical protein GCM10010912_15870 [Paenibacillus albidus]|uniref:Uncharacterized protein n=1 Tax=Paenibacillus albidus TaxID=2041023 RepID=A0A917C6R2_9BACL|nr:hypothetical protein [Paenibacillus albidus]GGF71581.1 hypothetical protein GCM10010912_15870 [Paenibacillus albidus]